MNFHITPIIQLTPLLTPMFIYLGGFRPFCKLGSLIQQILYTFMKKTHTCTQNEWNCRVLNPALKLGVLKAVQIGLLTISYYWLNICYISVVKAKKNRKTERRIKPLFLWWHVIEKRCQSVILHTKWNSAKSTRYCIIIYIYMD